MKGRHPNVCGRYVEDFTYFDDDEYLINVSKDVREHNFGVPLKSNAAMRITSGSNICIYAYKNERDALMLYTTGILVQFKSLPPKKDVCATQSPHQHPSV
jgi:hypothetical protein